VNSPLGSPIAVIRLPHISDFTFENSAVLEELIGHPLLDNGNNGKDAQYDRLADWFIEHVDHAVLSAEYL